MPRKRTNLSAGAEEKALPQLKTSRIGIVVSEWNREITGAMLIAALDTLAEAGIKETNIFTEWVPGSYELPLAAQFMIQYRNADAVICLGCVIQGETRHFEFICQAVVQNIAQLGLVHNTPVIFGVLTTNTMQQAVERSGGKHGNKGVEAAVAALNMIALKEKLKKK